MITLKKTKTLLLALAMALAALGLFETLPGVERLAVTAGLEIISGNDRAKGFGPMTESPALAGINVKSSGTQVAF